MQMKAIEQCLLVMPFDLIFFSQWRHKSDVIIPAAFFDRFFLWSFWLSSTLPWLVCLAYVRGFYFLFCCVEVSSVVLRSIMLCCIALCCDPLCCVCFVALHCVAIRWVAVVLYLLSCIALRCLVLVVIRCVALPCAVLRCWQVQHF